MMLKSRSLLELLWKPEQSSQPEWKWNLTLRRPSYLYLQSKKKAIKCRFQNNLKVDRWRKTCTILPRSKVQLYIQQGWPSNSKQSLFDNACKADSPNFLHLVTRLRLTIQMVFRQWSIQYWPCKPFLVSSACTADHWPMTIQTILSW